MRGEIAVGFFFLAEVFQGHRMHGLQQGQLEGDALGVALVALGVEGFQEVLLAATQVGPFVVEALEARADVVGEGRAVFVQRLLDALEHGGRLGVGHSLQFGAAVGQEGEEALAAAAAEGVAEAVFVLGEKAMEAQLKGGERPRAALLLGGALADGAEGDHDLLNAVADEAGHLHEFVFEGLLGVLPKQHQAQRGDLGVLKGVSEEQSDFFHNPVFLVYKKKKAATVIPGRRGQPRRGCFLQGSLPNRSSFGAGGLATVANPFSVFAGHFATVAKWVSKSAGRFATVAKPVSKPAGQFASIAKWISGLAGRFAGLAKWISKSADGFATVSKNCR